MSEKARNAPQPPARRQPRQARALQKIDLVLEAAMRLLDQGDVESLTTNAIAEKAGISIGTLYQYFGDKQAILEALIERELGGLADRSLALVTGPAPEAPGDRVRLLMRNVLGIYGGRTRVHRLLIEHALGRGEGQRLNPLFETIAQMLASRGVATARGRQKTMTAADAFVLTYSIVGVVRGYSTHSGQLPKRQDIEDALVRMALRFFDEV